MSFPVVRRTSSTVSHRVAQHKIEQPNGNMSRRAGEPFGEALPPLCLRKNVQSDQAVFDQSLGGRLFLERGRIGVAKSSLTRPKWVVKCRQSFALCVRIGQRYFAVFFLFDFIIPALRSLVLTSIPVFTCRYFASRSRASTRSKADWRGVEDGI